MHASLSVASDPRLPIYRQLSDLLRSRIEQGHWAPGSRIPPESELAEQTGAALGTVRRAIEVLVDDGLLTRQQGRGTFVRKADFSNSLFRFFRMTGEDGALLMPQGRILARRLAPLPAAVAERLSLRPGAEGLCLDRLRLVGDKPALLECIWLEAGRFAALAELPLEDFGDLLYPLYERACGAVVARATELLTVGSAGAVTAERLGIAPGAAVVVVDRLAYGYDGRPMEWRRSWGAADKFAYSIEIR
ncbi:GntR family transcriptional regulator [Tistlia consotensis]|uniref:Transcriptional regulator, GntR family n=1 Tax=Tistlia consotensis USBA 355 TaxID=560819 RepID=A0A1Y6B863_9PROT|nr:GntR family transcriptional regulator [Tistlia consotensis]SME93695.1 transcriptional regulator, GntR family [Tistlia consotensis USBA 355]SNR28750.1 GntR family transcriptional regulator [Tistlia consotensis]